MTLSTTRQAGSSNAGMGVQKSGVEGIVSQNWGAKEVTRIGEREEGGRGVVDGVEKYRKEAAWEGLSWQRKVNPEYPCRQEDARTAKQPN